MFYPSQKRELLRGICYFINDSATYWCFALVSKYCAALAKEYAPMKKSEFCTERILRCEDTWIHSYRILPNRQLHGMQRMQRSVGGAYRLSGDNDHIDIFDNGEIVARIRTTLHNYAIVYSRVTTYYSLIGNVQVSRELANDWSIVFINYVNGKRVFGRKCVLCKGTHTFRDDGFVFSRPCLSTGRLVVKRRVTDWLTDTGSRRLLIARSILDYAQKQL